MLAAILLLATLDDVPKEIERFIPASHEVVAVESGDVNRDGRGDYVLVVEKTTDEEGPRTLLVLTREADGSLRLARSGPKAVFCRSCGGVWGDPFEGLVVDNGKFTVLHYGGSNWRWGYSYTFAWSRRDQTWQLVRVESRSFHTSAPQDMTTTVHTPPRHFGKIDLADFDPEDYLGKGPK